MLIKNFSWPQQGLTPGLDPGKRHTKMASRGHTNVTTINLASSTSKKVQSTDDILKQIESTLPSLGQQNFTQQQGGLNAQLQGRINQHELAYGDKALPRQRLPKMGNVLLDRYQAARHNVLVLGAIQQAEGKSKSNTHRSHKSGSHTPARSASRPGTSRPGTNQPGNSRPGTSTGKAAAALLADTAAEGEEDDIWAESSAGGALSAGPSGLDSDAFGSFKSRGSSKALGSIPESDGLDAQQSGVLNPEASAVSAVSAARSQGRRYSRQGSNSSMASRASLSSTVASGLTSGASSSGRHLRQQHSYVSSGGSSGHTLRSHRAGSVAGSHFGGHRKGAKRKPPKPEPGRITRCFTEFGQKDDWVSKTVLKHTLAAIIQAHWRGYWVRQRWKVNREQLVLDERARLDADSLHQARLQDLQHKLTLYEQKKLAQAAAEAAAAAAGQPPAAGAAGAAAAVAGSSAGLGGAAAAGGSSVMSRMTSAVQRRGEGQLGPMASWQSMRSMGEPSYQAENHAAYADSDSDTGWSDVELDDVAAIKFRAVTPPWQRVPDRARMSLALQQRTAAAAAAALGEPVETAAGADWGGGLAGMGSCWGDDGDDTTAKLQELRHRRICRKPDPVQLSSAAVAAAAAAGLLSAADTAGASNTGPDDSEANGAGQQAAAAALPQHVIEALLLERYQGKYSRLGVPHRMPGRQRWLKMQAEAAAAPADEVDDVEQAQEAAGVVGAGEGGAEAPMAVGPDTAAAGGNTSAS